MSLHVMADLANDGTRRRHRRSQSANRAAYERANRSPSASPIRATDITVAVRQKDMQPPLPHAYYVNIELTFSATEKGVIKLVESNGTSKAVTFGGHFRFPTAGGERKAYVSMACDERFIAGAEWTMETLVRMLFDGLNLFGSSINKHDCADVKDPMQCYAGASDVKRKPNVCFGLKTTCYRVGDPDCPSVDEIKAGNATRIDCDAASIYICVPWGKFVHASGAFRIGGTLVTALWLLADKFGVAEIEHASGGLITTQAHTDDVVGKMFASMN